MFFGVSLWKNQIRQVHGEDQGPSSAYLKRTSQIMCDELQQHIEEHGVTSLCNVNKTKKGCTDKQKESISEYGRQAAGGGTDAAHETMKEARHTHQDWRI